MNQRFPCASKRFLDSTKLITHRPILCKIRIENELGEMCKKAVMTHISRAYTGRAVRN
jgi:hypothetical protein